MEISKQAQQVRALLESERNGLLSTISKKIEGWPFGSVTPYTLMQTGSPLILISDIAEHTRNIRADARVSLLVQDARALKDPQAGARATLIGYGIPVAPPLLEDAQRRYANAFPNSSSYFEAHDFSLFQIGVTQIRFIGGFGEIYWIDGGEILDPADSPDGD